MKNVFCRTGHRGSTARLAVGLLLSANALAAGELFQPARALNGQAFIGHSPTAQDVVLIYGAQGNVVGQFRLPEKGLWGVTPAHPHRFLINEVAEDSDWMGEPALVDDKGNRLHQFVQGTDLPPHFHYFLSLDGTALVTEAPWLEQREGYPLARLAHPAVPSGYSREDNFYFSLYSVGVDQQSSYGEKDLEPCLGTREWGKDRVIRLLVPFTSDDFLLEAHDAFQGTVFRFRQGQCLWALPPQPTPWSDMFTLYVADVDQSRVLLQGNHGFLVLDAEKGVVLHQTSFLEHVPQVIKFLERFRPELAPTLKKALEAVTTQPEKREGMSLLQDSFRLRNAYLLPGSQVLVVADSLSRSEKSRQQWAAVFDTKNRAFQGGELILEGVRAKLLPQSATASDSEYLGPFALRGGGIFAYLWGEKRLVRLR